MSGAFAPDEALEPDVLDVRVRHRAGIRVVELHGELDLRSAPRLTDALRRPGQGVLVDCRSCTFADSSGLAALLAGHRHSFAAGYGYVVVAGREEPLGRMLEMTGLVQVLAVYDSVDEALRALTGG